MTEERRASRGRPRPRKPTLAERREQHGAVDDQGEVVNAAARILEARQRSVAEVRARLLHLGYRTELVDGAVERLAELGLLDDDAFARSWVESRDRARPRGEHALRRELGGKGVDRALVDVVLTDRRDVARLTGGAGADAPDEAAAERLLARKLASLAREPDIHRRRQRAYALLARNGFAPDVCARVARRLTDTTTGEHAGGGVDEGALGDDG